MAWAGEMADQTLPSDWSSAFASRMTSCFIRKWDLSINSYGPGLSLTCQMGVSWVGNPAGWWEEMGTQWYAFVFAH